MDLLTPDGSPLSLTPRQRALVATAAATSLVPYLLLARATPREHLAPLLLGCAVGLVGATSAALLRSRGPLRLALALASIPGFTLTQAYVGGIASPNAILLVISVLWFAILGSRREMALAVVVTAGCCVLPMLFVGAPAYPVDVARASLVLMVVLCVAVSLLLLSLETDRLTERLRHEAREDAMTGLLNRRGWQEEAQREEAHALRSGLRSVVVAVDLDGLKEVNDRRGHRAGDEQILAMARSLRATFRADDVVARLGGDEFAVLMSGADVHEALETTERLRSHLLPRVPFSTGVVERRAGEAVDDALARADAALYEAKQAGGGRSGRAIA